MKTITKLPNHSTNSSGPLWITDRPLSSLKTSHRLTYKGHFHRTKIPGPECLIARNKKPKVSAYLSTLPLSPPENILSGSAGRKWLANSFESREVKWRRNDNLNVSTDSFDVPSYYQTQFTPKKIEARVPYVTKHIPLKSMEKFDSVSTYFHDYQSLAYNKDDLCYLLPRRQPSDVITWSNDTNTVQQPFYRRKELPPIDSDTSYRTQFPHWSLTPRHPSRVINEDNRPPMNHGPFDSESIYKADYTPKTIGDTSNGQMIMSSCGSLNRELINHPVSLIPYLEYQRPVFYTVKNEN